MAETDSQVLSLATADSTLRVEFHWRSDRYIQKLFVDDVEVGSSVEGDGDDDWPPSPPLQQLSQETVNGAAVILGVGSAGRSHWSISVEVEQRDIGPSLKFDLACRCKDSETSLGSTYRISQLQLDPADAQTDVSRIGDAERVGPAEQAGSTGTTRQWSYRLTKDPI